MIFRTNQKLNLAADEISFKLSYSHIDVKRWLKSYALILLKAGLEAVETEANLRHWLENEPFKGFPQKYREVMSLWSVHAGLRKKYISVSAIDGTMLIFSESIVKKLLDDVQESE